VSLDLEPALFWQSTPREAEAIAAGANERLRLQHNISMKAAYIGAILTFASKRPPLDDYLIAAPKTKSPPQTLEQQIAIAHQWSAVTARTR
jgi:hypothetical protein